MGENSCVVPLTHICDNVYISCSFPDWTTRTRLYYWSKTIILVMALALIAAENLNKCLFHLFFLVLLEIHSRYMISTDIDYFSLPFFAQVNQLSLGWALGFMINATNLLPVENPGRISVHLIQSGVYLIVVIVGALLTSAGVLICALSLGRIYKQKRLRTRGLVL